MTTGLINALRYSMAEGARRAGVSTGTLWRWALQGVRGRRLRTLLVGGRRYVLVSDLETFLAAGREPYTRLNAQSDLADRAAVAANELDRRGV